MKDNAVVGFLRPCGAMNPSARELKYEVLYIREAGKRLTNVVSHYSGDEYETDIYYIYTLISRSDLPAGVQVDEQGTEIEKHIY